MNINVREELERLAEPEYQAFSAKLLPGVSNILGVRLPYLRKMAKKIAKEDWKSFLDENDTTYFESIMLQGMVTGYVRDVTIQELFPYIDQYVAKIDNWSTCDSFCSGLKITKEYEKEMWDYLQKYFRSTKEYEIRFAVVMGLNYYIQDGYVTDYLTIMDQIHHEGYYVKMAVAWGISMIYLHNPKQITEYLKQNHLDDFTHNKAIQKIRESYQVSKEEKTKLLQLKRAK